VLYSSSKLNVDIKVINASLTQINVLLPLTHVEIPRLRDATQLNNDGMIKLGDVHCQTEPNWSQSNNVRPTDGQIDDMQSQDHALHLSRGKQESLANAGKRATALVYSTQHNKSAPT